MKGSTSTTILTKLSPSEFDLVREVLRNAALDAREIATGKAEGEIDPRERQEQREFAARCDELLARIG